MAWDDVFALVAAVVVNVAFYGLLLAAVVSARRDRRGRREALLRAFAARLEGGEVGRRRWWRGLVVRGRLGGRELRLTLGEDLSYSLRVPGQREPLYLELRAALEAAALKAAGQPPGAQAREVEAGLRRLASSGFHALELRDGWLTVRRPAFEYAFQPHSLEQAFAALEPVARLFARQALSIQVKVGPAQEAYAWAEEPHALRCPYCRDALAPEREELAACPGCRTVHHAECLTEAGRCTVFGCAGQARGGVPVAGA